MGDDVVEQLRQIAVQHVDEAVGREIDPVIRDAVLLEVVGADFLRSLAGADLNDILKRVRVPALEGYEWSVLQENAFASSKASLMFIPAVTASRLNAARLR